MGKVIDRLKSFLIDRRGNIAIITGLCALPLMGLAGLAIDYAVAVSDKQKLDAAADAAAIAAITKAQSVILANGGVTGSALTDGQAQGAKAFKANAGSISFGTVPVPTIAVSQPTPLSLSASVLYSAAVSNNFGGLFGQPTTNLQGTSKSALTLGNYIDIYVVMDVSQSMGIAATPTDMQKLFTATKNETNQGGCVFGCHVLTPGQTGLTNQQVAQEQHIPLRIDVVKTAVQSMIAQVKTLSGSVPTVSVGLYTMELGLSTVTPPTTNYPLLTNLAAGIDLGNDQDGGTFADTSTQVSLASLTTLIGSSGDGTTALKAKKYVFILTDGTSDTFSSSCWTTSSHCVTPYDPAWFSQINQNATTGIIYTPYYPIYNNNDINQGEQSSYKELVDPVINLLPTALKSCTSTPNSNQWFIQASDSSSLNNALYTFLAQSLKVAQITQ